MTGNMTFPVELVALLAWFVIRPKPDEETGNCWNEDTGNCWNEWGVAKDIFVVCMTGFAFSFAAGLYSFHFFLPCVSVAMV